MKNDVNVPSKRAVMSKNLIFLCHLEIHRRKDPDPFVKGTDPRIWVRTKMSRIRNTVPYVIISVLDCLLKVPKCEIFDRSDFHYFYNIKPFWIDDFGVKILTYFFKFWGSRASFSFLCAS